MSAEGAASARPIDLRQVGAAAVLVLAVFLSYARVARCGFIWDDDAYVTANPTLRSIDGLADIWLRPTKTPQYYPVTHTTFWIEYHLWGLRPIGYHLDNVLLHAASAVVLWRLLRRLEVPAAFFAAILFAVHPVHVESVAWVTERKNVLSGSLYLLSATAAVRALGMVDPGDGVRSTRAGNVALSVAALLLFAGALLSKSVTCSLPAALVLVAWCKGRRIRGRGIVLLSVMFLLGMGMSAVTSTLERTHVGASGREFDFSPAQRVLIAGRAVWFYAGKLLWPAKLTFVYPRWDVDPAVTWQWAFPVAAVSVVAALWLLRGRWGRGPLVAVLFFVGTLTPALGFLNVYPMRFSFVADHFQYLASIGLLALIAATLDALASRAGMAARAKAIGAGTIVVLLGALTFRQTSVYRSAESVWRDTIAKNDAAWLAHEDLGAILNGRGDVNGAIECYANAHRVNPDHVGIQSALAGLYLRRGDRPAALRVLGEAIQSPSDDPDDLYGLSLILAQAGEPGPALAVYREAFRIHCERANLTPGEAEAQTRALFPSLGSARAYVEQGRRSLAAGRPAEAAASFLLALQGEPENRDALEALDQIRRDRDLAARNRAGAP